MVRAVKILGFVLLTLASGVAFGQDFVIVANRNVSVNSLSPDELSNIYLLKKVEWDDGIRIVPVNREGNSGIRGAFTSQILKQRPDQLENYWERMRYKGISPPPVQQSDQSVLAFVQQVPGAIGYVNSASAIPKNVKLIAIDQAPND